MQQLASDQKLGPMFQRANTTVQFNTSDPDSVITARLREDAEPLVDCGATALETEVVMTMQGDVAHRFWLGQVSPTVALARGEMQATGPVAKILRLVPLVEPAFPRYVAMLEQAGRDDLLAAARESWDAP